MGKYVDELMAFIALPDYELEAEATDFTRELEDARTQLRRIASMPGWSGQSADAATQMFTVRAQRYVANADVAALFARRIADANEVIARARTAAAGLPPGALSPAEQSAMLTGSTVLMGPLGALTGAAGVTAGNQALAENRERAAHRILARVSQELTALAGTLTDGLSDIYVPGKGQLAHPEFPNDRMEAKLQPWDVGWEWLTNTGEDHHEFREGDDFTEMLREHWFYRNSVEELRADYDRLKAGSRPKEISYQLKGPDGVLIYINDYSTLLTGGITGNLAATYLGSHGVVREVLGIRPDGGIEVEYRVTNDSNLESATRPPVVGYWDWYEQLIGVPTRDFSEATGMGSKTSQELVWTETIYPLED